jgi:hypothetical protein
LQREVERFVFERLQRLEGEAGRAVCIPRRLQIATRVGAGAQRTANTPTAALRSL